MLSGRPCVPGTGCPVVCAPNPTSLPPRRGGGLPQPTGQQGVVSGGPQGQVGREAASVLTIGPVAGGPGKKGGEGQDPSAALQGRQVVRSSALSVETPRKKCGHSSSCCQPRRRGPQGRGDVPPPPEGSPPPALTTSQGGSSLRLRPRTRRKALTGLLDYEGANPRLPPAGGRPGRGAAQVTGAPHSPPVHSGSALRVAWDSVKSQDSPQRPARGGREQGPQRGLDAPRPLWGRVGGPRAHCLAEPCAGPRFGEDRGGF